MVTLRMANGSMATIAYLVGGDPGAPKELVEVFGGGTIGTIDDFKSATISRNGRKQTFGGTFSRQNKGHDAEVRAFCQSVAAGDGPPVPFASALNSTRATFAILSSLETGTTVHVDFANS